MTAVQIDGLALRLPATRWTFGALIVLANTRATGPILVGRIEGARGSRSGWIAARRPGGMPRMRASTSPGYWEAAP